MSVDYALLPVFTESRKRQAAARRALPDEWCTDSGPEADLVDDLRADMYARVRQHIDELRNGSSSAQAVFLDDR